MEKWVNRNAGYIEEHGLTVFCRVLLNANEFIHVM